jgi:hypothetical protein
MARLARVTADYRHMHRMTTAAADAPVMRDSD